jgi:RNA:NAD 2'-phosphotransferase (TPT1/KptA family)
MDNEPANDPEDGIVPIPALTVAKRLGVTSGDTQTLPKLGKNAVSASKAMSLLLRHSGRDEGLTVSADGWVSCAELLKHHRMKQIKMIDVKSQQQHVHRTSY